MNTERIDILLVEDNEYEAKLAIYNLRKHNLANHLIHLKDGALATDFIFGTGAYQDRDISRQPKVILLDVNLPKVTGLEIIRMLKENTRTSAIPVVLLTASSDSRDVREGYALGVNSIIVKPLEFEAFSRMISQLGLYWILCNQPSPYIPASLMQSIGEA